MIKIIAALLTIFALAHRMQKVNVGIILGFTGPIESLTPDMAAGAELAFSEASSSGKLLNGSNIMLLELTLLVLTLLLQLLLLRVLLVRVTAIWVQTVLVLQVQFFQM